MNIRPQTLSSLALAGLLLGASVGVQAEDAHTGISTGVGHVISLQGNAALQQIREELRQNIERNLQPITPGPQGLADAPTGPANQASA